MKRKVSSCTWTYTISSVLIANIKYTKVGVIPKRIEKNNFRLLSEFETKNNEV